MGTGRRAILAIVILGSGLGAQVALEAAARTPRPLLKRPLATLPMQVGRWLGRDEPIDADVLERAQTDDYLNRTYEDPARPGRALRLWINYSTLGLNLRHSPEICLPSGGWTKIESLTRVLEVPRPSAKAVRVTRLGYSQADVVQGVGFWYYIFGEGSLEHFVRSLPITSRSSHGRTTRGSGLTVEVFCPGGEDPDGEDLKQFAAALLEELEPLLPEDRACYHIP
jgi:hypothetical protein